MPTIYVLSRNMKNIRIFYLKTLFLEVKFSIYLNRRVFVMPGSNPAGGEIQLMNVRRFIAQGLSLSPFHHLN